MLDYKLEGAPGILSVAPRSPLTAADFKALAADVDTWLETHDHLSGLLLDASDFAGWESLGALVEHINFVRGHHKRVARVAVLTDNALLKIPPQIAAHFVHPEIKVFGASERAGALAWLRDVEA